MSLWWLLFQVIWQQLDTYETQTGNQYLDSIRNIFAPNIILNKFFIKEINCRQIFSKEWKTYSHLQNFFEVKSHGVKCLFNCTWTISRSFFILDWGLKVIVVSAIFKKIRSKIDRFFVFACNDYLANLLSWLCGTRTSHIYGPKLSCLNWRKLPHLFSPLLQ